MQPDLLTLTPETSLLQVHRLFVEEEINGAPVVDDDGNLIGVISSMDLLRAVQEEYESGAATPTYFRSELPYSGPDWLSAPEDLQDRMSQSTVADAMVREVVTVSQDAPVEQVAAVMRDQNIHRVFVVDEQELCGILTTFDLLQLLVQPQPSSSGPGAPHFVNP